MVPDELSSDSVQFMKVKDSFQSAVETIDDYKNVIAPGLSYNEGRFMKKLRKVWKTFSQRVSVSTI